MELRAPEVEFSSWDHCEVSSVHEEDRTTASLKLDDLSMEEQDILTKMKESKCVICMEESISAMTQPCKHACLCRECGQGRKFTRCPMCRAQVQRVETNSLRVAQQNPFIPRKY